MQPYVHASAAKFETVDSDDDDGCGADHYCTEETTIDNCKGHERFYER
jgi:hypothetical protein